MITVIAALLFVALILEEVRIIKFKNHIKTLEHYIDMYKNKLEARNGNESEG